MPKPRYTHVSCDTCDLSWEDHLAEMVHFGDLGQDEGGNPSALICVSLLKKELARRPLFRTFNEPSFNVKQVSTPTSRDLSRQVAQRNQEVLPPLPTQPPFAWSQAGGISTPSTATSPDLGTAFA